MRKPEVHEHKNDSNYRSKVVVMMMIVVVLKDEMRHSVLGGGTGGGKEGCGGVFLRAIAIQVTIPSIAINL